MRQSIPKPPIPPPPGQTPGHLTFWKNFGQIARYIASLDGQMPRRLNICSSFLQIEGDGFTIDWKRKAEVVLRHAFNTYEK